MHCGKAKTCLIEREFTGLAMLCQGYSKIFGIIERLSLPAWHQ